MTGSKHRPNFQLSKAKVKALGTLITMALVIMIFREKWLLLIGNFLIIEDDLRPADIIHVIAGEDYRTEYAIQLYKQGYGKILFFTGGWCEYHDYYHGKHAEELALSQGVLLNAIAYDDSTVTSTYMEAEKLKEWLVDGHRPVQSVIVVSDPFHMRRAQWTYRKVLGNAIEVQMAPVPFEQTPYIQQWWKDHTSRVMVREEYEKLAYYLARYQFSWGIVREWLATLDQN